MTRRIALAVALLAGLCADAAAGWWDDAGTARRANLADVRRDADRWRDVTIVLDVRFARAAEAGSSFFTRFTPKAWRALAVWTPEEAGSTAEPFARLFVRRGSPDGPTS